MISTSDDLYSVFLADLSEAVPNKKNITVRGILEKSWLAGALKQSWRRLLAGTLQEHNLTDGSRTKQMRIQSI